MSHLPNVFYLGQYEVTQTEWKQVMGTNPSRFHGCARCPVESVDFYQVNEFLSRLNAGTSAMRYRLPTEAEWEYACRAGTNTPFNTGAQALHRAGERGRTVPVCRRRARNGARQDHAGGDVPAERLVPV